VAQDRPQCLNKDHVYGPSADELLSKYKESLVPTCIEDFLPLGIDVSQSDEHVDILGMGAVFPALDAVRQRHQRMSSYLGLLVERDFKLQRFGFPKRFQRERLAFGRRSLRQGEIRLQVKFGVSSSSQGPFGFPTTGISSFRLVRVVTRIASPFKHRDGGNLGVWTEFPSPVILVL
jgi:hypothetical protein